MIKERLCLHKGKLMAMSGLAVVMSVAIVVQAYLIVHIIDRLFLQQARFQDVLMLLMLLVVVVFLRTFSRSTIHKIGIQMASEEKQVWRLKLLDHFSRRSVIHVNGRQTGRGVSDFIDTVDEIERYYRQYIPQVVQLMIIPVVILGVIFWEHWATGIIVLMTAPFIFVYMALIGMKTGEKSKEQVDKMARFSAVFLDTLQGLQTIKLFNFTKQQREKMKESSVAFRDATMSVLKVAFGNALALEFISMLSIGIVALEVACRMIILQDTTFSVGFLMLILAPEIYRQLKDLGAAFHSGKTSKGALAQLHDVLAEEDEEVQWGEKTLSCTIPPRLVLENVSFSYKQGFIFQASNIVIEPKEFVAIVGTTGSGKTTLLHILAGLLPIQTGNFYVNRFKQQEITEASWFSQISYVTQDAYLFAGTIAENIVLGSTSPWQLDKLEQAIREAGIYDWIQTLPAGVHTPIGEGGRGLSGGERQRVLIARAFFKKPHLIFFDEPTTGLDVKTERIIQKAFQQLTKTSTVIVIAHRLHTIRSADKIIHLEGGEVSAIGSHQFLHERDERYMQMVNAQKEG